MFGPDGAWLLLSIVYYSWRAHFDLATSLMGGQLPAPSSPPSPKPIDTEFAVVRHLQVLGFTYAAAEVFATLIAGARAHEAGTSRFLDAYATAPNLVELVPNLATVSLEELRSLIGTEDQIAQAVERVRREQVVRGRGEGPVDLDAATLPVTEVGGGLVVPRSIIDAGALLAIHAQAAALAPQVLHNIAELQALVDDPEPEGLPAQPQSMRKLDNSFRHGLRIMFHSAVPDVRQFKYVGPEEIPASDNQVTVYTPSKSNARIQFGGVRCEPQDTAQLLDALQQLCERIGQFARAFVGAQCEGFEGLILSAGTLRLADGAITASDESS